MKYRALIFLFTMSLPSWATTYYVLPGGSGTKAGTSWSNARCAIPDPLAAGDIVYIGNVVGQDMANTAVTACAEPTHSFSGSGTSGAHITIKAATGADHGTATGWSSSMGVDVNPKITWSNAWVPSNGLKAGFWTFCGSYYDFDGKVGTADSTGTYGFYLKSAGDSFGMIKGDSHDCGESSMSNINFQNVEVDGVNANSTNNDANGGSNGLYFGSPVSASATVGPVSFTQMYIHDLMGPFSCAGNCNGVTFGNDWIETNFSSHLNHSNAIDTQMPSGGFGITNLTVYNTVFTNIVGTGVIMCLNGACDGWKIYNNIIYYTSDFDSVCQHGMSTSQAVCGMSKGMGDNTPAGLITNSVFYGNTFANVHLKAGFSGADSAGIQITISGSSNNVVENNLWWNCTAGPITATGITAHDYNTWLNTALNGMSLNTHESQTGTAPGGAAVNPFTNSFGTFTLTSETADAHLNDGVSLSSPYNLDFAGATRGADGTWERGAFQFNAGNALIPPTNLSATVQ